MFYQNIKHRKSVFCFPLHYLYIIKQTEKPNPCITLWWNAPGIWEHSRNVEKTLACGSYFLHWVYISLVFSNARRVLSQCNTRLRLLYLLNNFCIDRCVGIMLHLLLSNLPQRWPDLSNTGVCLMISFNYRVFKRSSRLEVEALFLFMPWYKSLLI